MESKRDGDWIQRQGVVVQASVGGYSKVEFSTHALDQMKIRSITQPQVLDALSSPTETGLKTQPGRKRVAKRIGPNKSLHVVYYEGTDRVYVITTFPKIETKRPWRTRRK